MVRSPLLQGVSSGLANKSVLIAGAAAAANGTNELAVQNQREPARRSDQGRIERRDVGMTGFIGVVEQARLAAETCRGTCLADRNINRSDLRAIHPQEVNKLAVGIDDCDCLL